MSLSDRHAPIEIVKPTVIDKITTFTKQKKVDINF